MILIAFVFEDKINGYAAKKRLLPGTEKAATVFTDDRFLSTTEVGETEWNYSKIKMIAETADFFVFIFSSNHAQLYDKKYLQGGTADDFRSFIEEKTGRQIQSIS